MKFPKMKRNQIRSRIAAKGGSYSLAVTAIVLAILIAVNILASVLPTSVTKYDITWTYQGVEFDIFDFSYALRALAATNFTVETPTGQEEISLTLHLDNEEFPTFTLTLYRLDGESCIACVDGESVAFVSRDKAVDLIEAVRAVTLGA